MTVIMKGYLKNYLKEMRKAAGRVPLIFFCITASMLFTACSNQAADMNSSAASETVLTTEKPLPTEAVTATPEPQAAPEISLSGNPLDSFTAENDCYAEGDKVILYIQKGVTVKGDVLEVTETIMEDLCEATGLTFDKHYQPASAMECRDLYFEPGIFAEVNKEAEKINILIVNLEDAQEIEWASDHNAILDVSNYDYELTCYQTIYHELAHVIHFRNGVSLGSTLSEGFAVYMADKAQRAKNMPAWNAAQYYFPASFDDSLIMGGEDTFQHMFDDKDTNYQYGFRFVAFLFDTYGDDIFARILAEAAAQSFEDSYDPDNEEASKKEDTEQLITIIKSQTAEDVFEQFGEWYTNNWSTKGEEYMTQMESITRLIQDNGQQ